MRARLWGIAVVIGVLASLGGASAAAASGISGHVIDSANQPLEGIEVCSHSPGYVVPTGGCARTDAGGDYSIPEGAIGDIVQFDSTGNSATPGYGTQWWPGVLSSGEAQRVTEADASQINATMRPGGNVDGKIVSRTTSLPVEGVEVCPTPVVFSEGQGNACAHTDAAGDFVLRGLSEIEYRLELRTEGDVNFVEARFGPISIQAGGTIDVEASLVPGFEIEGTVTEAGTGKPVGEAIPSPHSGTMVCAVDAVTEERIKCVGVGPWNGGHYSIPGLPPGRSVGVTFGVDHIEEGFDLGEDGYVRRYWDEVPTWGEAAFISGSGGSKFGGIDAQLTQGEEVFPRCEVKTACAAPSPPTTIVSPPSIPIAPTVGAPAPPATAPAASSGTVPGRLATLRCKAGYRRAAGSRDLQCVKVRGKHGPRKHRRPAHPRRHTPAHR